MTKWYTLVLELGSSLIADPIVVRYFTDRGDLFDEIFNALDKYYEDNYPDTDEIAVRDVMDKLHVTYEICGNVRTLRL